MRASEVDVAAQLKRLTVADRKALLALWQDSFGRPPGFRSHVGLLRLILAYRVQAVAQGSGLRQSCRKRLLNLAEQFGRRQPLARVQREIKPGTRLIREWHGETHVVSVLDKGVEYRGKRYGSLSEAARTITGVRWSGPAFFGLKGKPAAERRDHEPRA